MKNKKTLVILIFFSLAALFYVYPFLSDSIEETEKLEYVREWNDYLNKRMNEDEEHSKKMSTADKKIKDDKFARFAQIVSSRLLDIDFYGKVIDQNDKPVSGVIVEYVGASGYLTSGSGSGEVQTDENGLFHIINSKGVSLIINAMHKSGFEIKMKNGSKRAIFDSHQRFPDSERFQNYASASAPYIFKAWKLSDGKINTVKAGSNRVFFLEREYLVSFYYDRTSSGQEPQNGLKILFSKQDEIVTLSLKMMGGGGLLETKKNQYMNIAPEVGYQTSYNYQFDANKRSGLTVTKYLYYKIGISDLFGKVKMTIMPNYKGHTKGYISFRYQTNLDGTRFLEN